MTNADTAPIAPSRPGGNMPRDIAKDQPLALPLFALALLLGFAGHYLIFPESLGLGASLWALSVVALLGWHHQRQVSGGPRRIAALYSLAAPTVLWEVDTLARFNGKQIQWAIAESPLVDENYVYCMPGGPDAAVAALDKNTGETVWTSKGLDDASAYSSPNSIVHNGRRILVTMTAKGLAGLDAGTGEVLWTRDQPDVWGIHANTPVYADGMLYFVAGSKVGGVMLRLSEDGSKISEEWTDTEMDTLHGGVVLHEGYLYGTSHRSGKEMLCLALKSGQIMWRTPEVTEGAIVFADGMLYNYEGPMRGVVSLIKATPEGFERTGEFKITKGEAKHWAHPVVANGRLYIRRGEFLWAYDVTAK